jgi:hypothetical protein
MEGAATGWYETYNGWYEAAEEGPDPAAEKEADAITDADEEQAIHHREMVKLNAAIEARLTELTRETKGREGSIRASCRRLGDLIGRKNEVIAREAARRLLHMPSPDRRAHEEDAEAELGREERQRRQQANKEA